MDGRKLEFEDCIALDGTQAVEASIYGARAAALVELRSAGLQIPRAWAFSVDCTKRFARADFPDQWPIATALDHGKLLSLRASPVDRHWGGPRSILNLGMTAKMRDQMAKDSSATVANAIYFRFIQDFATKVSKLDGEDFEAILDRSRKDGVPDYAKAADAALGFYEAEMDAPFPQNPDTQIKQALRSMAAAWNAASARILREARGAPSDAGLAIIAQEMVLGLGDGEYGSGVAQFVSPITGERQAVGRYLSQSQGREALTSHVAAQFLAKDARGPSLEDICPQAFADLKELSIAVSRQYRDAMQLEFTVEDGAVWLLDAVPADRNGRGAVAIIVRLVEWEMITREEGVMRILPRQLNEMLHPQIAPKAKRQEIAEGIGASPGAGTGKLVFSANAAIAAEARGEQAILVRHETTPDDIRGMQSSAGILTERGGINSHAAVVARTLGLPCIVSAEDISIDARSKTLRLPDGTELTEGAIITLDGASGHVLWGAPELVEPDLGEDFQKFMTWADEFREMGVRGNADTPRDVRLAKGFGVDGIGLVRTEHMFFEPDRLTVMRELIFAEADKDRTNALNLLLPMQRDDFYEIFALMREAPVCIRLLDPPLHEFLPKGREQIQALADATGLPMSQITARVEDLAEFNPMLGTRGVRLGITVPEIYEMQARAIFDAAAKMARAGVIVKPEIMIPLVSANREVELVKARIDAVASAVQSEQGVKLAYKLGVMVETPRAALRAHDIAKVSEFMSFGTNDLTQMTYGLSRDDAGRFMRSYVQNEIFEEDPFLTLDSDGVGELIEIAVERAREGRDAMVLGLCGEHGGDPDSVAFCHSLGFDYVSCSPFRTPVARLAAAQAALRSKKAPKKAS
ncbi:MAG: pyruvate, phosphate dikinase [Pseudomonadota bacterium]